MTSVGCCIQMNNVYSHDAGERDQTISTSGFSLLKSHSEKNHKNTITQDEEIICGTLKIPLFFFYCKSSMISK